MKTANKNNNHETSTPNSMKCALGKRGGQIIVSSPKLRESVTITPRDENDYETLQNRISSYDPGPRWIWA